jgi:hypothetical protein
MKPQIKIFNCETGQEIVRDATEAEILQMDKDAVTSAAQLAARADAEANKEAALGKLAALGLTAEDLKALGL